MSTHRRRSGQEEAPAGQKQVGTKTPRKKPPVNYTELCPGWRISVASGGFCWALERQRVTAGGDWFNAGYCTTLEQILAMFAQTRVRAGVEDGTPLVESVRAAAGELADLLAKIKDATLVLEQPKGAVR